jgi:hypothetical protein
MSLPEGDPSPIQVFIAAAAIGGLAGLASALRTSVLLTGRYVGSSILTASLSGLLTALIGHNYVRESANVYFLLGVSGLAGYGGATLLDAALAVLVKFVGSKGVEIKGDRPSKTLKYQTDPSDEVKP